MESFVCATHQKSFTDDVHLWKWLCTFPKLGVARVQKRLRLIPNALPDPFVDLFDLILSLSLSLSSSMLIFPWLHAPCFTAASVSWKSRPGFMFKVLHCSYSQCWRSHVGRRWTTGDHLLCVLRSLRYVDFAHIKHMKECRLNKLLSYNPKKSQD